MKHYCDYYDRIGHLFKFYINKNDELVASFYKDEDKYFIKEKNICVEKYSVYRLMEGYNQEIIKLYNLKLKEKIELLKSLKERNITAVPGINNTGSIIIHALP